MALEILHRIAGWREVVVEQTAGDEFRIVTDKGEEIVHAAGEIGGCLFEADDVLTPDEYALFFRLLA